MSEPPSRSAPHQGEPLIPAAETAGAGATGTASSHLAAATGREGDPANSFFILTRGAASVRRNDPGGEREISTLKAGDFFGEIGLLTGTPRNATVRATAPSEVLELDAEGFRDLVESSQLTKDRIQARMEERLAGAGGKRDRLLARGLRVHRDFLFEILGRFL